MIILKDTQVLLTDYVSTNLKGFDITNTFELLVISDSIQFSDRITTSTIENRSITTTPVLPKFTNSSPSIERSVSFSTYLDWNPSNLALWKSLNKDSTNSNIFLVPNGVLPVKIITLYNPQSSYILYEARLNSVEVIIDINSLVRCVWTFSYTTSEITNDLLLTGNLATSQTHFYGYFNTKPIMLTSAAIGKFSLLNVTKLATVYNLAISSLSLTTSMDNAYYSIASGITKTGHALKYVGYTTVNTYGNFSYSTKTGSNSSHELLKNSINTYSADTYSISSVINTTPKSNIVLPKAILSNSANIGTQVYTGTADFKLLYDSTSFPTILSV